jgi:hypothetical protein
MLLLVMQIALAFSHLLYRFYSNFNDRSRSIDTFSSEYSLALVPRIVLTVRHHRRRLAMGWQGLRQRSPSKQPTRRTGKRDVTLMSRMKHSLSLTQILAAIMLGDF